MLDAAARIPLDPPASAMASTLALGCAVGDGPCPALQGAAHFGGPRGRGPGAHTSVCYTSCQGLSLLTIAAHDAAFSAA